MAKKKKSLPKEALEVQTSLRALSLTPLDYDLKPLLKDGKVIKIELTGKTSDARMAIKNGGVERYLNRTNKTILEIEKKNDETLVLRYVPKGTPGRKPAAEATTALKKDAKARKKGVLAKESKGAEKTASGRKKPTMRKFGHRKFSKNKAVRKRLPKLRLPRNSSNKQHVVMMIHLLNSFRDTDRAECLNILAQYTPRPKQDGKQARSKQTEGQLLINLKSKRLPGDLLKVLMKHKVKA